MTSETSNIYARDVMASIVMERTYDRVEDYANNLESGGYYTGETIITLIIEIIHQNRLLPPCPHLCINS